MFLAMCPEITLFQTKGDGGAKIVWKNGKRAPWSFKKVQSLLNVPLPALFSPPGIPDPRVLRHRT